MDTLKHTEPSDSRQILSTPPEVPVGNLDVSLQIIKIIKKDSLERKHR